MVLPTSIFSTEPKLIFSSSRLPFATLEQTSTYILDRMTGSYNLAVTLASTSTVIGLLGSYQYPEIGYLFSPAHASKGYATEALQAFLPHLFAAMPEDQLFAEANVDTENNASIKLLERCGWRRWGGVERAAYESPLLGVRDSVCYRIARPGHSLEDLGEVDDGAGLVPDLQ